MIRILIPWDDIPDKTKLDMGLTTFDLTAKARMFAYDLTERNCTRPITPEDIRSCLRMPDEWTEDNKHEYEESFYKKDAYNVWQVNESLDVAKKAIDIALRPAPTHKPCPFCGGEG